jgi:8-oxo-dGTP pyrophosphatase MutT (NUDIX family)
MMQLGPDTKGEIAVPRDAATVLLLREAQAGFEVFMVKRSGLSDVLGEAHVFPGGKIDAADSSPAALARVHGLERLDVAALGEDVPRERAAGMFVAAARETFEEAGVLLAHGVPAGLKAARDRVNAKEPLSEVLTSIGAMLDAAAMVPWVRWVTPEILARRFDARFFLAVAPSGQAAVHDDYEATHSEWLSPREAIERWRDGSIKLAPPTYMSLAHLALFDSLQAAMTDARSRRPPVVQPVAFEDGGVRCLAFPGDERHPVRERAIPGPMRMKWDGAKFAPF